MSDLTSEPLKALGEHRRSRTGSGLTRGKRGRGRDLSLALTLLALLALTTWQVAHSEALVEARAAYEGREPPLRLHSFWNKAQEIWGGASSRRATTGVTIPPKPRLALQRALDHLAKRPRDPEAARLAALSLTSLEYPQEAEPYYRTARRGGALTFDDLQTRALGLARGNLREEAIAAFQEILASKPDDASALQRLAAMYYSRTQLKEALATAQRLAAVRGGAVPGNALIGIVYHDDHKFDQAIAAYERVLALDPDLERLSLPSTIFYTDLAQDLIDAGRPADARRHLERALSKDNDPALIGLLGSSYRVEGRNAEAEECWKRAIASDPKMFRPWLELGTLALADNRPAKAVEFLEKAHSLSPGELEPVYLLGIAYGRTGRPEDAQRFQKKAEEVRRKLASEALSKRKPPSGNL